MLNYIVGRVCEIGTDSIVLDANGIGYNLYVAHPGDFILNEENTKVYVYLQVREDEFTLFGFKTKEEKRLFLRLINVSGIGPKTTITMLSETSTEALIQAIETSNTSYLKKLPGIGPKAAQQIILDLKGKLVFDNDSSSAKTLKNNEALNDTREALKSLGFKVSSIDAVLSSLGNENLTSEEYLRKALQLLRK